MALLIDVLVALLPLLYGVAAVNYAVYFVRHDDFAKRTCTKILAATFCIHIVFFLLRFSVYQRFPMANLAEVLSMIALAVCTIYLYVEKVQGSKETGCFVLSFVVLLQVIASGLLPHAVTPGSEILATPLFGMHLVFAVFGYSGFFVGAAYSFMAFLLYRSLKQQNFGLIFDRLPSLDVLIQMSFGAALLGWCTFSLAILLGMIMSVQMGSHFLKDPQFIATIIIWFIYAFTVMAYFKLGWRNIRAIYLSLFGFSVALVAVLGAMFIRTSFHGFSS
ncbi:MAG: hypothetical protein CMH60_01275 [Myxococcales bacterium]|nr:hypothetical protein [Myxococcales bacterium]|tara:strand:- start:7220 stop:8047 length:828 start_codon:yes stop_codon:yes gene_type:complete